MKLNFFYSFVYFSQLNKFKKAKRLWPEVKEIGKQFENKYQSEINQLLGIIPKVTGKPWHNKTITVYITDWPGPSFSHPLTLKVNSDLLLMLVILTHEFLHDFYLKDKKTLGIQEVEKQINQKVEEIFKLLKINADKQIQTLWQYHKNRFS